MIEIFIENLRKYNEGTITGKWVTLPTTKKELETIYKEIGDGEIFIADYTAPFLIKENDNIEQLNKIAEILEDSGIDEHCAKALFSMFDNKDEVLNIINNGNYYWHENETMEDVALEILEDLYGGSDMYNALSPYIDLEAYARDIRMEGSYFETDFGVLEVY